ncbi:MAG: type IV secretory system conjugative DNA transfer family protein, partial [Acidimicrobiales bacterium]
AMVGAARPESRRGDWAHWVERAEAVLAPLLHAAALGGTGMDSVLGWVLRHDAATPRATLCGHGATIPSDVLAGLIATDGREQSGIWSTAAGVLAAYRSEAALKNAGAPNFEPAEFGAGRDTVYICSPAEHQAAAAPIVVAFLTAVRSHTFARAAEAFRAGRPPPPHVLLALDEVANIAPLPDLPATVSEAGGQGLLMLACLQDLSQARRRWGPEADGLLTLFGTKVVLGGLAERSTLELVSLLSGDEPYASPSVHRNAWWARPSRSEGWSVAHRPRLAPDAVRQLAPGTALVLAGSHPPAMIAVPPWNSVAPFAPRRRLEVPSPRELGEVRGLSS